jgi:transcriptional regulator with XRE-family HTH domain
MKAQGMTKTKLGELLGAGGSTQQKIQKASQFLGSKNEKIDLGKLKIVAAELGLTPDQLLIRNRDLKKHISELKDKRVNNNHLVPLIKSDCIPCLTTTEEGILEWLVWPHITTSGKHLAVEIQNDSLSEFHKGDIVIADTRQHLYGLDGRAVLARVGADWFVRNFSRGKNGEIIMTADNKERYPDKIFTPNDEFILIGPIVGILKKFNNA